MPADGTSIICPHADLGTSDGTPNPTFRLSLSKVDKLHPDEICGPTSVAVDLRASSQDLDRIIDRDALVQVRIAPDNIAASRAHRLPKYVPLEHSVVPQSVACQKLPLEAEPVDRWPRSRPRETPRLLKRAIACTEVKALQLGQNCP